MLIVLDTKVCNLNSWVGTLNSLNQKFKIIDNNNFQSNRVKKMIFPGIGNFLEIAQYLKRKNLDKLILQLIKKKIPILGVCMGMQILLNESEEAPGFKGLGIISGKVKKINTKKIPCPHNGWNNSSIIKKSKLFQGIKNSENFYYNHSYYCDVDNKKLITRKLSDGNIASAFEHQNIYGVQFHPEKSHEQGKRLLKNFLSI
ncbi:imidazole glycerol phosphate synthase subunit HisH [Candidatus Pelagibacter sp. Uisw_127]|uniref:imidazole glycerol phosphate synthase subunit HisH n=1 Tax=Candidatus Pelagibacter sp. Uisw_127 TaxID=3230988 RepID=UPI0039E81FC4